MGSRLELLRCHEKCCLELHFGYIKQVADSLKCHLRQAEPRLNARLERWNITMHVSATNAKQTDMSALSFTRISQKPIFFIAFLVTDAVIQGRSSWLSTRSARGGNSINLSSLTSSSDRRCVLCPSVLPQLLMTSFLQGSDFSEGHVVGTLRVFLRRRN